MPPDATGGCAVVSPQLLSALPSQDVTTTTVVWGTSPLPQLAASAVVVLSPVVQYSLANAATDVPVDTSAMAAGADLPLYIWVALPPTAGP